MTTINTEGPREEGAPERNKPRNPEVIEMAELKWCINEKSEGVFSEPGHSPGELFRRLKEIQEEFAEVWFETPITGLYKYLYAVTKILAEALEHRGVLVHPIRLANMNNPRKIRRLVEKAAEPRPFLDSQLYIDVAWYAAELLIAIDGLISIKHDIFRKFFPQA